MTLNILLAEDEERLRRLIRDYVKREGYNLLEAENGKEALEIFEKEKVDLVILDVMMPIMDGFTACKKIREISKVPVMILTAKSEEDDQLTGFEAGADEYVLKPFSPKVLIARIKALMSRMGKTGDVLDFGELKIDKSKHKVFLDGIELNLTPKEYDLILAMAHNKGIAMSRESILDKVWGYDYFGDFRTVDTHIKRLRKKLDNRFIETVRGFGYRFEVKQ